MTCQDHDHLVGPIPGCIECLNTLQAELREWKDRASLLADSETDIAIQRDKVEADLAAYRLLVLEAADSGTCPWCHTHAKRIGNPHSLGCPAQGLLERENA